MSVAFQFTARTGIGVQVLSLTPGAVDVLITLSSAGYTSPELPPGHNRTWTKDDLATASSSASGLYSEIQWMDGVWETLGNVVLDPLSGGILSVPTVEAILGRGVVVDEYDTSPMTTKNILDTTHAFMGEPSAVPGGAGGDRIGALGAGSRRGAAGRGLGEPMARDAAGRRDAVGVDGEFHHPRLRGVIAAIVVGIVADGLQHHPPQHPVARRHLGRLRRHRHQHVHV